MQRAVQIVAMNQPQRRDVGEAGQFEAFAAHGHHTSRDRRGDGDHGLVRPDHPQGRDAVRGDGQRAADAAGDAGVGLVDGGLDARLA